MKLTDANKIRDYVKEQINPYGKPFDGSAYEFGLKLIKYLENMSTDYDIDKVVEELDKASDYYECEEQGREHVQMVDLTDAIEIVKHDGVSYDVCEWKYNDTEYYWESSCEHLHIFMADGPKENEYIFCPYCGKKIKVVE